MLVFEERGKPEYPEKNPSEQGREPTNKLNPHLTPSPGIESAIPAPPKHFETISAFKIYRTLNKVFFVRKTYKCFTNLFISKQRKVNSLVKKKINVLENVNWNVSKFLATHVPALSLNFGALF